MPELELRTQVIVDAYWAGVFGCPVATLRPTRGVALPHAGCGDYAGLYAMAFGDAPPVASVPLSVLRMASVGAARWGAHSMRDPEAISSVLGIRAGEIVGPATLSYGDAGTLTPMQATTGVRVLDASDPGDVAAVESLRGSCPAEDWEHGGSALGDGPVAGAFVGGDLVALAGYELWGGRLAHITVVTHPAHRGQSHGRSVVRAVADVAIRRHLVPQYRALQANVASLRLGLALGFAPYAVSLAIRLREERQ